jgi:stearoyl-CoA desaturase (delta-9 desaturase)
VAKKIDWTTTSFIIGYHLILLVGLPFYFLHFSPSGSMWAISAVLLYAAGMSVTAGYHRLYSHSTYKASRVVEALLLFFGSLATQGSALKWSFDHRKHHAFVDTEKDPYSIRKGFWFAHILWLFHGTEPIDKKVVADLYKNRLVMFQHKYYGFCMVGSNLLVSLLVGYCLNDYVGAFVISWLLRMFFLHHFTWFINSLAHTWGAQSFSKEHSAVDNYCISLLTFGEGYHNYHHTFANDYRNGIKWYHFDPTKWLIWTLAKLGLASNLRKMSQVHIQEKILLEDKEALSLKLKNYWAENKAHLEQSIESVSSNILDKFSKFQELASQYREFKRQEFQDKDLINKVKTELNSLQKSIQQDWKDWKKLSRNILRLKPKLAEG